MTCLRNSLNRFLNIYNPLKNAFIRVQEEYSLAQKDRVQLEMAASIRSGTHRLNPRRDTRQPRMIDKKLY